MELTIGQLVFILGGVSCGYGAFAGLTIYLILQILHAKHKEDRK